MGNLMLGKSVVRVNLNMYDTCTYLPMLSALHKTNQGVYLFSACIKLFLPL